ncbi:MAG: hypothetical protein AABX83_00770 [Nanoarchaeota archaeon]
MTNQVKKQNGIIRILDGSVLEAYNESIKGYNEKARKSLGKFSKIDGELTGSSPLMLIQLASCDALLEGVRLATRDDLEYAKSQDSDFLRGHYTDFGLALITAGDPYAPNDLLVKRLTDQLKHRNIKPGKGKLIPLGVLSLADYEDSGYGVVIDLKEEAEKSIRDLNDFKWDYMRDEGLSCTSLGRYMSRGWGSGDGHLADSIGYGRVVVVND